MAGAAPGLADEARATRLPAWNRQGSAGEKWADRAATGNPGALRGRGGDLRSEMSGVLPEPGERRVVRRNLIRAEHEFGVGVRDLDERKFSPGEAAAQRNERARSTALRAPDGGRRRKLSERLAHLATERTFQADINARHERVFA